MSVQPILTAALRTEQDVVNARQRARTLAAMLGFDRQDQTRMAAATRDIPILVVTSALLTAEVLKRLEGAIAVLPKSNLSRSVLRTFAVQALQQGAPA